MKIRIIKVPNQYKYGGELNAAKWHDDGGPLNPYSARSLVDAIYSASKEEQFLGKPSHNYNFTISEEEANKLGYYPDKRGHRDDRVKKPTHPTHPSRGKWNSFEEFELTDKGIETPNYTLFGLNDGGQDPQAIMTYKGRIVLPEITVTPKESYIMNPYDNIKIFDKGGYLINKNSSSQGNTHGGDFSNGVTQINSGGLHSTNPYEGVQMGVDSEGVPNLVEEGEVIFNDYVFSNRLNVPDTVRKKYKLRGNKELTFADAAKQMQKESEERPNDPISRRGLLSSMSRLQQAQEIMRQQNQVSQEGVQYAHGGKMGRKYDGKGDKPNFLQFYTPQERQLRTLQSQGVIPTYTLEKPYSMMTPEERTSIFNTKVPSLVDTRTPAERWINENIKPIQFNPPSITNKEVETTSPDPSRQGPTWLRYAPVVGSAIGLVQNLFSKPDYSSADAILEAANQAGNYQPVSYTPIGNYLQYKPFDRDFYINKLNAQSGATRRALAEQSGGNRATAMAGLLAADYNAQGRLGDLARQAEEYNLAQRQAVEQFNRATDQANAEMGLKAAMANQEAALKARSARLSGVAQAMATRDAIDARRGASRSANFSNLFESLGNIGVDEMNRADRDMLIRAGVFGTLSEKPQGWSNKRWEDYKKTISGNGYSKGGKLKKRRGGLTY